ncbi:MAG TPA: N-acetylmuramoyl-L-alanine amidase [Puia sp.]|uniref:N-acetylmuramoyl-L-alanine amidase n=1 Tax=Puia sp. TaxID=2045100 RepID=UPI002BAA95E5|nr:N-acetylmuramoyl-L-alanine amidase [Puia sp.]HVU96006.1 N-acetylmuramoyl-L-alanine amidase [Puia sp.]
MIEMILRSAAISGVLFVYYWLFLRNRVFHRWNRGFLLGTVLLALVMPLVPLPGFFAWAGEAPGWPGVLHAVAPGNWGDDAGMRAGFVVPAAGIDWSACFARAYWVVAGLLGFVFLRELGYVFRLYKRYPCERRGDVLFLLTQEPGTPFSFLKTIFWHADIDVESDTGRQMLRHELVHVRQRHSLDLLLLRPLMIVFWVNPFLYFIYRELRTLHEFEADRCVVDGGDGLAYAELLVRQTLESRQTGLFHSFFSSSIKRRISMITQFSFSKSGRLSRWMVAPLAVLLLCAFSGRVHRERVKPITVVIDAGHGGWDDGAVASNGLKEKNINLSIARKVKQLASEYGVDVVLTRDKDELSGGSKDKRASLHYRADLSAARKADLFISLHTDAGSGPETDGFHIYVSKENRYFQQSERLGSALVEALKPSYKVGNELRETQEHVWVLRAATVPAVTILCGNIDNERDRAFISAITNQEKIARDILQGVISYSGPAAHQ